MLKGILNIFRLKKPKAKSHFQADGFKSVAFAFEFNKKRYYKLDNVADLPYRRAFRLITLSQELESKLDELYIMNFTKALEEKVNLFIQRRAQPAELLTLIADFKSRQSIAFSTNTLLRIACVLFFEENENIYDYSQELEDRKLKEWINSSRLLDFFLSLKLNDYIPNIQNYSDLDFPTLIQLQARLELISVIQVLSAQSQNSNELLSDYFSTLHYQALKAIADVTS